MEKESRESDNDSCESSDREDEKYLDPPLLQLHELRKKETTSVSYVDELEPSSATDAYIEVRDVKVISN
jgi:hypothetical protein